MHGRTSAAALLFALSLLLLSGAANAATITVTSAADTVVTDDGQCTLREAIIAANTNSPSGPAAGECIAGSFGADAIVFAIPGAGVQTITLTADLPQITELLTIDGYSQPGASANTLATGDNATLLIAINGGLFTVFNIAANSTIRGIDFTTYGTAIFQNVGGVNNTRIIGNFFGTNATGTAVTIPNDTSAIQFSNGGGPIGSSSPADRNIFAGVGVSPAILITFGAAAIQGNYFGVDSSGNAPLGLGEGVRFQVGSTGSVGTPVAGAGNVFGNWNVAAIEFRGAINSGALVQGNLIGTNATGTARLATGGFGILANNGTDGITIGGSSAADGNVISGALNGIELDDIGDTWFIGHNKIGTDISGLVPIPNTNSGICATQTGSGAILNNTIAFNGTQGVDLGGSVTFLISANSIFSNGGLGISLQGLCDAVAAPLANDTCDADAGANGLQNFPIITAASISAGNVTISGTINTNPGTSLQIGFYSNAVCDPSGNGEGQTFLGATSLLTGRSCDTTFGPVTFAIPSGQTFITATASTNAIPGATSEFSPCFAAAGAATTDVAITKTDSPDPVNAGSDLTYTITVTNNGPSDASSVSLTDALPANTTFVSFVAPAGWTSSTPPAGGTGTVTATNPLLAAAATATFTLVVHVDPATAGTISNTATVTTTTTDTNPGNNSATATTTVAASADLSAAKTDAPDPVTAGNNITYTITVANAGPSNAASVSLTDGVPANTTFVSVTAPAGWTVTAPPAGGTGTITATNPSLAAGTAATFTLVVNVNSGTASGTTITNTATVASATPDPNAANNSATATTQVSALQADLSVTKSGTPSIVTPGSTISYTITVANSGPAAAASVTLSDAIPANTTFVSATAPAGWTLTTPAVGGTGTVTATNPSLAATSTATFTLVVRVASGVANGTTVSNTATVASTTSDPNAANNSATATTTVNAAAAIPALGALGLLLLMATLALAGAILARQT